MKKLLSLLSVLTISATAMPNIIAESSYEKQQYKIECHPGRLALKQWEKHWKSGWFENLTKEK